MLKIKDNVDLKELERFGFEDGVWKRKKDGVCLYCVVVTYHRRFLQIHCNHGYLFIEEKLQDLLFDLIQAGLVEKVEG